MVESQTVYALGLCSGGLDSILSALVLKKQGIEVHWITFETPFFPSTKALKASEQINVPLIIQNITETYMKMMLAPGVKFGKNMNPCMDCHSLMFRLAGDMMIEKGYDFLFSGEVLGQRPMSQNKSSLRYVEKHSGYDGYIVRPLSARNLPETKAERDGLVDRNRLLGISGRSRKEQMQLAKEFGVTDFPAPAGGCLLTDKIFSRRLKDLFEHQSHYPEKDLELLKFGRHMRLDASTKLVVGRSHTENEQIGRWVDPESDVVFKVDQHPGPLVVIPYGGSESTVMLGAGICAGYSKAPDDMPVMVNVKAGDDLRQVTVLGITPKECKKFMIH